jgi:hypothetical protein
VNAIRKDSALRVGLLLAVVVSWFAFSNRCALGLLLSSRQAAAVQHHCCDKQDLPKQAPSKGSLECCKVFHVVANGEAKAPALESFALLPAATIQGSVLLLIPEDEVRADAGPPPVGSFTELVLQRSLRSHAPPFVA